MELEWVERERRGERKAAQAEVGLVAAARTRVNENFVHNRNMVKYMRLACQVFIFIFSQKNRRRPPVFSSDAKLFFQLQHNQRETAERQHYL